MATETAPPETSLRQAMAGDQAAFAELVHEHESMVFSIAWHFLRNQDAAEELAQEVFLHLYRNLKSIETPAHLTHWLRKVTSHRCIDAVRRRGLVAWTALDDAPEPAACIPVADPMQSSRLARMVAGLPERWRAVVLLRYQEDLDPAEIAETLEMPVGTVKSTLHRALALLRTKMENDDPGVRR